MSCDLTPWMRRSSRFVCLGVAISLAMPADFSWAQEADATPEVAAEADEEAEAVDPFAVPADASVDELFTFMGGMARMQPSPEERKDIPAFARKLFGAVIAASEAVLEKSDKDEDQIKALNEKFNALNILVRYAPEAKETMETFLKALSSDKRDGVAIIVASHSLGQKASSLGSASEEEAEALVAEAMAFLKRFGLNGKTLGTVSSIGTSLGYSEHAETAAKMYSTLTPMLMDSQDEDVIAQRGRIIGTSRRMQLLGNKMELMGTTGAGEEFTWDDYKGKVVLVDFWASWCGPCMRELPNMKKNLAKYGDLGFTIVGINMDSTREKFEQCVEDKELTWANLYSDKEGEQGWSAPMATYYGISGIPTAILVDQKGKVFSLSARGEKLDAALEELLGPVDDDAATDATPEEASEDK